MTEPNWDRWDELLAIRGERGLDRVELREFDAFLLIVAKLEDEEVARSNAALGVLKRKHQRAIDSIDRLSAAVRRMTPPTGP